ncbi:MAG: hypothetical protein CM15mP93_13980 [Thiotrichaceae bacterium]|nr:MAG: hypothetical protein CM15mP93_13980 [Thiotrichaceae bacterium]
MDIWFDSKDHINNTHRPLCIIFLSTDSKSKFVDSSIKSNNVGKASQRLTHLLQPWHISKTRNNSSFNSLSFQKLGFSSRYCDE